MYYSILTTILGGFLCIVGYISCYKCNKNFYENVKDTSPNFTKSPLVVGPDLASENIECSICLGIYEVGQTIVVLNCMHFYHEACLNTWNDEHMECPQCREDI